ncbi:hypothetical protein [Myxococcus sp. RHSTA-1-4]|uniref:hypothetical protein n=1 Tax=Myxococcus sp. RHSTA-1-4 TaxID=2874601 RepID=UPI001CBDA84B|nr:hypothetical protein [Myxococcus sp. RHSTA-1-4]
MSTPSAALVEPSGPSSSLTPPEPAPERFAVHAVSLPLRGLGLAARLTAYGCLLFFSAWLVLDILANQQSLQPRPLVLGLALGVPLPLALAALLRWLTRATVDVETTRLVLTLRGGARMEIPHDAVESVRPWKLPLPGPGLSLRMKSGRAFSHGLEVEDAAPLLEALGRHGPLGAAQSHPLVRYAQARHALWRRRWYHLLGKLVLFPMLPAGIMFQLHQRIAFGSVLGEYQMYGLGAWLLSFSRVYEQVFLNFMLCACFLRLLVEAVSLAAAWLTPSRARGVRRGAEWFGRLTYYLGLMALLAARLLGN